VNAASPVFGETTSIRVVIAEFLSPFLPRVRESRSNEKKVTSARSPAVAEAHRVLLLRWLLETVFGVMLLLILLLIPMSLEWVLPSISMPPVVVSIQRVFQWTFSAIDAALFVRFVWASSAKIVAQWDLINGDTKEH
jgi:hypothetical protein